MSYIVPREKPKCYNCPFRSLDSCTLIFLMSDKDGEVTVYVNTMTVSPDCPLVDIPTPHGRLIDADVVQNYNVETFGQRLLIIDTAPTVIEAEGET